MFGKSFRIGDLFGFRVTLSWSFILLVVALSLFIALTSGNFVLGIVGGVLALTLVFTSILAHELGHALVARRLGIRIAEIELHLFGGAAKMLDVPSRPRDEMLIAAAGPVVSFVLAGVFGAASLFASDPVGVLGNLAYVNLILGAFNLVPALPTDGGRILRAALSVRYGAFDATRISVRVARVVTIALVVWAAVTANFFAIGIAAFLWYLGSRELRLAELLARRSPSRRASSWDDEVAPVMVEVFDKRGRYVGTAPGGAQRVASKTSPLWPSQAPNYTRDTSSVWSAQARERVYFRGPDGTVWVISQG